MVKNLKEKSRNFLKKARKTKKHSHFRQTRRKIASAKKSPKQQEPITEFQRRKRFWQVKKNLNINNFFFTKKSMKKC